LLGQTVNSYSDPSAARMSFSELLLAVADVPGMRRVRFTTSHPSDFGADIVRAIETDPVLCDHVHLPVQSGSTRLLRAMKRSYTREQYIEKIELIRGASRAISITSDIIVGFPGETDEDFADTLSLLDVAQYDSAFSFTYSPRPNTLAKDMPDVIPEEEKVRRLAVLQERQREIQTVRNEACVGREYEVLVDGLRKKDARWLGRTTTNQMIDFASPRTELLGQYLKVRVTRGGPGCMYGEQVVE
jgi:tRNA-2-methylthio-N6-dimethylallyladenosine synthase